VYKLSDIQEIHLEITQNCQAACPMCDRNQNGGAVNPHINLSELTIDDCKKIFTVEFIAQLQRMYMCGNLGDPVVARDTLEVYRYFRTHNEKMWLGMNTNGGARDIKWWQDLAGVFGQQGVVTFSVDGLSDTNHIYRQNVNWNIVERNMRTYIDSGGRVKWDYLIFEHNQHQVEQAAELAKQWGVERFVTKKSARFLTASMQKKAQHIAVNKHNEVTSIIRKPNVEHQNVALSTQYDAIVNNYGSMDNYHDAVEISCKVKKSNSLFITAEGLALPCCWTAGRMYKWWHKDPKVEQIWSLIDSVGGIESISALNGLQQVFDTGIFEQISNSWSKSDCRSGKLKVCAAKCGVEFDPFTSQFQ
jgi:MoaA/NifB/PqqE/SkfB family radical SAM enzyme